MSGAFEYFKSRANALKRETHALYLAARDPRTPWYAKLMVGMVVAYALSPIDLIPDFIPVLGYLDDLLLLPLGIFLAVKLIPTAILADARDAAQRSGGNLAENRVAAVAIVMVWVISAMVVGAFVMRYFNAD